LPEVVELVTQTLQPHHLTGYAQSLATAFSKFYDDCPVIREDVPADVMRARLKLAHAARIALAKSLHLMGMTAPERM
ncbi:MAG TPA: DALR anticodon-binding domain-containing protein, partial [Thermoflexales bacterium]|nr:DALR anticodon-binding domain-containing protein [Thermoflexales bacterium]